MDSAAIDDIERDALRALNKIVEDRGAVAAMQDRLIPGPASERAVLRRLSDIRFLTRGDRTGWLRMQSAHNPSLPAEQGDFCQMQRA